jgi:drug/metabolite transporter (DMT)-like permease
LTIVDLMLAIIVVTFAFNIIAVKYIVSHGFAPVGFASSRFVLAGILFAFATRVMEGKWLIRRGDPWGRLALAAGLFIVNQVGVVYALVYGNASTAALILGAGPIFTALFASLVGAERIGPRFAVAAMVSLGGVALIAFASGSSGLDADFRGVLFALAMTSGWAAYTVVTVPLMRTWSPYRISAVTFLASGLALLVVGLPQLVQQTYSFEWGVWPTYAYATISILLTNVLYLRAVERVGPSHAALYTNLQPFVAALLALAVLSESLALLEIVGGAAIAASVLIAWGHRRSAPVVN